VASFFVSRVDTNVDRKLEELARTELEGKAAVANARDAYRRFQRIFLRNRDGRSWNRRVRRCSGRSGRRPARRNPNYPRHRCYVDRLVGPHTVNTMPLNTMLAFGDHGEFPDPAHPTAAADPSEDLKALADAGIDMDQVTDELLQEGVDQFVHALDRLLEGIDERRAAVLTGKPSTIQGADPRRPSSTRSPRGSSRRSAIASRSGCGGRDPSLWGGALGSPRSRTGSGG